MQTEACILAKSLLILGAGLDQIPGILKAKEMGFYTICLDGNAEAEGKKYCDEFHIINIKDLKKIKQFLDQKKIKSVDGVIAFGVDIPYIISVVAQKLNVNYTVSPKIAKLTENKFQSKRFMDKHKIAIPDYQLVSSTKDVKEFIKKHGLPVVLKPVDNSASRGISLIKDDKNIQYYYDYALGMSPKKQVIVERFLSGNQISTESFVVDGKIHSIGFADRNYKDMDRFLPNIIENGGDLPSIFMTKKHRRQLDVYLQTIAQKLNLKNGVIKGDIVIHKNQIYIIEFALRLSGGNFSTIEIPCSTGVDFLKIAIKLHSNLRVSKKDLTTSKSNYVCLRYKFIEDCEQGQVTSIDIPIKNDSIHSSVFLKQGDQITQRKTSSHADRIASVIMKGDSREDAILKCEQFLDNIKVKIE